MYRIVDSFCRKYLNTVLDRNSYFDGNFSEHEIDNKILSLIMDILRYNIWQARLQKSPSSFFTIELETLDTINQLCCNKKSLKAQFLNCTLTFLDGSDQQDGNRDEPPP